VMGRYFGDAFRAQQASTVARFRRRLLATDAEGYLGCCYAVRDVDTLDRLAGVKLPALVIAGELDQGTPVAMSQALAERLRASLAVIPGAAHLSAIEQPAAFEQHVRRFVAAL
jgi:3-oxoadipate enol-lactonase